MRRFGASRSLSSAPAPQPSGPTLLSVGPFSNLTAPLVSSLPNFTYTGPSATITTSRTNPLKANTVNLNLSGAPLSLFGTHGSIFIWCDTLNFISGSIINANGQDGEDAGNPFEHSCPIGAGGHGGSGGGGGGAGTQSLPIDQPGGAGSITGADGITGSTDGSVSPGHGGFGFALPGSGAGGPGWISDGTPFPYLQGGKSNSGTPSALGFGAGGPGGSVVRNATCCPCCCINYILAPGGGGGGNAIVIVARQIIGGGNANYYAKGGNPGSAGCCCCNPDPNGYAGGGGSVQVFTQKVSPDAGIQVVPGNYFNSDDIAGAGSALIYQVAHDGHTIVNSTSNFNTANWNNT